MKTKYHRTFLCGGFSSAKLALQKSKPVMLLSQVKLAGMFAIDSIRDRHECFKYFNVTLFMRIYDVICNKSTTQLLFKLTLLTF